MVTPVRNKQIGEVTCIVCGASCPVARRKDGKLYYRCAPTACGTVQLPGPGFQEWMLENATIYGPEGKPETPPAPAPADQDKPPAPAPAKSQGEPRETGGDVFDKVLSFFDE